MIAIRYAVSDQTRTSERTLYHAEHKAYLQNAPMRVFASGPAFKEGSEATAAALLIVEVESLSELADFSANDPFVRHEVYAEVQILEWRPSQTEMLRLLQG